ncbi:MAG: UMP kinase [Candidatus Aenigmarchaeota archaeon]|nr:UMP kinase [Candidatus Aenigmarchaeota archaeon]
MDKKKIVIKLGGSFLFDKGPNTKHMKEIAEMIKRLDKDYQFIVIIGGGSVNRMYVEAAREIGTNESYFDLIGIDTSRLNARLFISSLGHIAYREPCKTFEELTSAEATRKVVVLGGLVPGQSTDAVAAEVAEYLDASRLVVAKDVDFIYSDDPDKNPNAVKYEKLSKDELVEIISKTKMRAKQYSVIDLVASMIIHRARFSTVIVNGADVKNMEKAILGDNFRGTRIV